MDITKLGIEGLKAIKCDIFEAQAQNIRDLDIVNQRLNQLIEEQKKIVKKVAKEVIKK